MDGALATSIWPGQWVGVTKAEKFAQFIILRESYSFYQTLQEKLQWPGRELIMMAIVIIRVCGKRFFSWG
jgi:NAD+ kinase